MILAWLLIVFIIAAFVVLLTTFAFLVASLVLWTLNKLDDMVNLILGR